MFVKSTAILALLSVAAQVAVAAQPPACVIAAVNTESDPSDFKTLCASDKAKSYMSSNCGNNLQAAQDYFTETCKDNDQTVTFDNKDTANSTSSSASASSTDGPSSTKSGSGHSASATGGSGGSGSNSNSPTTTTTSSSGTSPSATNAAPGLRLGIDVLGMTALLAFGALLAR